MNLKCLLLIMLLYVVSCNSDSEKVKQATQTANEFTEDRNYVSTVDSIAAMPPPVADSAAAVAPPPKKSVKPVKPPYNSNKSNDYIPLKGGNDHKGKPFPPKTGTPVDTIGPVTSTPPDTISLVKVDTIKKSSTHKSIKKSTKKTLAPRIELRMPKKAKVNRAFFATVAIIKVKDTLVFIADRLLDESCNDILSDAKPPKPVIIKESLKRNVNNVKVTLDDPGSAFTITEIANADSITLNDSIPNMWLWQLTAKATGTKDLTFTVEGTADNKPLSKVYSQTVNIGVDYVEVVSEEGNGLFKKLVAGGGVIVLAALLFVFKNRINTFLRRILKLDKDPVE